MRAGSSERELGDLVERAYVPLGGTTVIHFIGVTRWPIRISACLRSSPATASCGRRYRVCRNQRGVLGSSRPSTAQLRARRGADPLYCDLHAVADAAFDAVAAVLKDGAMPRE